MELNLCPSCDSFVKSNWTTCRACGADLSDATAQPAALQSAATPVSVGSAASSESDYGDSATAWSPVEAAPVDNFVPEDHYVAPVEPVTEEPVHEEPVAEEPVAEEPVEPLAPVVEAPVVEVPVAPAAPVFVVKAKAKAVTPQPQELVVPPPPVARSDDSWQTPDFLEPVELSYQRFSMSPTSQTVTDLRAAANRVQPVNHKIIYLIAILGVATLLLIGIVTGGVFAFKSATKHTTSTNHLVQLPSKPVTTAGGKTTTTLPASTTPAAAPAWISYTDPGGQFSIDFPTQPTVQVAGSADNKIVWNAPTKDNKSSAIVVTQTAPTGQSADQTLGAVINSDAQVLGATVKSRSTVTQNGHRQISAHMTTATGGSIDAIAFVSSGGTLYTVMVDSTSPDGDPTLFGHLTNTFVPSSN